MKYDFDKIIDRTSTNSSKWAVKSVFGHEDVLPLWVADMDFPCPEPVVEAIRKRAEHPIYGYTMASSGLFEAVVERMERKYGWRVKPEWIVLTPGVVPALNASVRAFAGPQGKVVIQSPVYPPFHRAASNNECQVLNNRLKLVNGHYQVDFEDLRYRFENEGAKMMILCSPHNPVGRVWTREELVKMGEIVIGSGGVMVSDEIHCEIVYKGHRHVPFASISEEFARHCITCIAPSKTFNIPGLHTSAAIIPDEELRNRFNRARAGIMGSPGLFGLTAMEAAFRYGDEWLEQVLEYLESNVEFTIKYFQEKIPQIKAIRPEGTYLVWLDCRELGMDPQSLSKFFREKAKVGMNDGYTFGPGGEGFMRLNVGCPRSILEEALRRIERAVKGQ